MRFYPPSFLVSKPDLARTLYEQLITGDKVDLLMGPYATANTLAAMGVAQRNNKVLVSNSFGIPSLAKYDMHFPGYAMGFDPGTTAPNTLLDALAAGGQSPKTVAMVTRPRTHRVLAGRPRCCKTCETFWASTLASTCSS